MALSHKKLSPGELSSMEKALRLWFCVFGVLLVVSLVDLLAFFASGLERAICIVIGSVSTLICLYVAHRLRDVERFKATVDAEVLLGDAVEDGVMDDD